MKYVDELGRAVNELNTKYPKMRIIEIQLPTRVYQAIKCDSSLYMRADDLLIAHIEMIYGIPVTAHPELEKVRYILEEV